MLEFSCALLRDIKPCAVHIVIKASALATSYAMIPVNNCELSVGALDLASVHDYRGGDIQYFESASDSWKNSSQAEAHVVLVNFR